jgi:hypothetical protein
MAAMIAARLFNDREGAVVAAVYGAVTTGTNWRFLKLEPGTVYIDQREYYIDRVEKILSILVSIIGVDCPVLP